MRCAAAGLLLLGASPAAAQFDGGPGSRPHASNPRLVPQPSMFVYSAGTATTRTYDPGVSYVALDSCTITIPPAGYSRTFLVWGAFNFGGAGTHGQWMNISLDGTNQMTNSGTFTQVAGQNNVTASAGPMLITVPGNGASHTIAISVTDAGATGNLNFNDRWIVAVQLNQPPAAWPR